MRIFDFFTVPRVEFKKRYAKCPVNSGRLSNFLAGFALATLCKKAILAVLPLKVQVMESLVTVSTGLIKSVSVPSSVQAA